jgi:hypothetical protein
LLTVSVLHTTPIFSTVNETLRCQQRSGA